MAIPRRFSLPMREIWMLQLRLELAGGRRSQRVLSHPRFRAAYDFLLLRGAAGEVSTDICEWWTKYQKDQPKSLETEAIQPVRRKRQRRSRPRRGRRRDDA
jgi:poly(A) polymerase